MPDDDTDDLDGFEDTLKNFETKMGEDKKQFEGQINENMELVGQADSLVASSKILVNTAQKGLSADELKNHALEISKRTSDDVDGTYYREHFEVNTRKNRATLGANLVDPIQETLEKYTYKNTDLILKYADLSHKISKYLRHGSGRKLYDGAVSEKGTDSKISSFFGNVITPMDKAYFYNPIISEDKEDKLKRDTKRAIVDSLAGSNKFKKNS